MNTYLLKIIIFVFLLSFFLIVKGEASDSRYRARELGIDVGIFKPGKYNAITDVEGVRVGHKTIIKDEDIRTGVTAILPHPGNIFQQKVPAAIYIGNGYGKLIGYTQVNELGNIETPIVLTNTLSVWIAADAVKDYILSFPENKEVYSINPVVAETNDSYLNNIQKPSVQKEDVIDAIVNAKGDYVEEGSVGAGTGTVCFGFKGGIGTSSRILPKKLGGYTIGVLVQTNYNGLLTINGKPLWKTLINYPFKKEIQQEGSCIIVIATDAPLDHRNLYRLAKRAILALGKTGSFMSNGSGDYAIAFSTNKNLRIYHNEKEEYKVNHLLPNDAMNPLFQATIEATEEAILNSLLKAKSMKGYKDHMVEAIEVSEWMKK